MARDRKKLMAADFTRYSVRPHKTHEWPDTPIRLDS